MLDSTQKNISFDPALDQSFFMVEKPSQTQLSIEATIATAPKRGDEVLGEADSSATKASISTYVLNNVEPIAPLRKNSIFELRSYKVGLIICQFAAFNVGIFVSFRQNALTDRLPQ